MIGEEVLSKTVDSSEEDIVVLSVSDVLLKDNAWLVLTESCYRWNKGQRRHIRHPAKPCFYRDQKSCQTAYRARRLALAHEGYIYSDLEPDQYKFPIVIPEVGSHQAVRGGLKYFPFLGCK